MCRSHFYWLQPLTPPHITNIIIRTPVTNIDRQHNVDTSNHNTPAQHQRTRTPNTTFVELSNPHAEIFDVDSETDDENS